MFESRISAGETQKVQWEKLHEKRLRGHTIWKNMRKSALRGIANWQIKKTEHCYNVSRTCSKGTLSYFLKCLYLVRIGRPDISLVRKRSARDKRSAHLIA